MSAWKNAFVAAKRRNNSAAAALVNFGGYGGAPHVFRRRPAARTRFRRLRGVVMNVQIGNTTIRRPIITHYLHNISGEGDGWTTEQWHGYLHTWIPTKQPKIRRWHWSDRRATRYAPGKYQHFKCGRRGRGRTEDKHQQNQDTIEFEVRWLRRSWR